MALDFCPYDFQKLDLNKPQKLAYELVMARGIHWEDVKQIEFIEKLKLEEKVDSRLRKFYFDESKYIILDEPNSEVKLSKFEKLLQEIDNDKPAEETQNDQDALSGIQRDEETDNDSETEDIEHLKYEKLDDGRYEFKNRDGRQETIMYAYPCCPRCHHRLPVLEWFNADDFCAISLMINTYGGKTTFLLSMMHDEWEAFNNLGYYPKGSGKKLTILSANDENNKDEEKPYNCLKRDSKKMCRRNGECPDNTNTEKWIEPVFLHVSYGDEVDYHTMIVGIYDNAGEVLRESDIQTDSKVIQLKNMDAYIYMVEPKDLGIHIPKTEKQVIELLEKEYKILSLQEQAECQKSGEHVVGKTLLQRNHTDDEENELRRPISPFWVYNKFFPKIAVDMRNPNFFKNKYFCGTIVKSDLLENSDELKINDSDRNIIFDRNNQDDYLDDNAIKGRQSIVENMIDTNRLFGSFERKNIETYFKPENISWHCISALGCATEELEQDGRRWGRLLGDYDPIRVAEPVISCILSKIISNNWT